DAVLLALLGAAVVPPAPLADRDRQVGLLSAVLDLAEDRLAQPLEVRGARLGVGVLGAQVVEDLGILRVLEPGVGVVDGVAVVGSRVVAAGRDRLPYSLLI